MVILWLDLWDTFTTRKKYAATTDRYINTKLTKAEYEKIIRQNIKLKILDYSIKCVTRIKNILFLAEEIVDFLI